MSGNNGSTEVSLSMHAYKEGVNVREMTDSGNMMLTTILFSGKSIYSRNSVFMGEFITSQYYGICEIK